MVVKKDGNMEEKEGQGCSMTLKDVVGKLEALWISEDEAWEAF